ELKDNGYDMEFADSIRADGGCVMRGNDLLVGAPDVMVTDTLSFNSFKHFSTCLAPSTLSIPTFGHLLPIDLAVAIP
ncbi:hypothetical protein ACTPEM_26805, partial [Clostridioides difficile]